MIKLTPKKINSILNSSSSIIRIIERIIQIDNSLETGSWYAIKASDNLNSERESLKNRFENNRKTYNKTNISELENNLKDLNDKLQNYKVNSFVRAIGRQFIMAEIKDLKETIALKQKIQKIPILKEIISIVSEDNLG